MFVDAEILPVIYLKIILGVGLALFLDAYLRYYYICYHLNYVIFDIVESLILPYINHRHIQIQ